MALLSTTTIQHAGGRRRRPPVRRVGRCRDRRPPRHRPLEEAHRCAKLRNVRRRYVTYLWRGGGRRDVRVGCRVVEKECR